MTTTSVINIDILDQKATCIFSINSAVINDVSLSNNQLSFNARPAVVLNTADMTSKINQLQGFQASLLANFPGLLSWYNKSMGNCHFALTRNDGIDLKYSFKGNNGEEIDNWTYDFSTKLCSIASRVKTVTVTYAAWAQAFIASQRFITETKF